MPLVVKQFEASLPRRDTLHISLRTGDPARPAIGHLFELARGSVLVLQPERHDIKLQLPHGPHDRLGTSGGLGEKHLRRPLLRELTQAAVELLALERVRRNGPGKVLGGETRNALKLERPVAAQRIANTQIPAIHDADHVTGPCLFNADPIACHKLLRGRQPDRLPTARMQHLHVRVEMAGDDAHERHAVAVLRIHVRLNLEHETGELDTVRLHLPGAGFASARWRSQLEELPQKRLNPKVGKGRTEEYRRKGPVDHPIVVIRVAGRIEQFNVGHQTIKRPFPHGVHQGHIVDADNGVIGACRTAITTALEEVHFPLQAVVHAHENVIVEHGPGGSETINAKIRLHVLNQLERIFPVTVALIHERENGRPTTFAHLEQLPCALFHPASVVEQHNRAVCRNQCPIGVF